MIISFDLDLTLIPYNQEFEVEFRSTIAKWLGIEEIRLGTPGLIRQLKKNGHKIYIYTTSYRKPHLIKKTLKYYGIHVNKIITQPLNNKKLTALNIHASKYPPAFNIDLHIDDSFGVQKEGKQYGFKTLIISTGDKDWINTVYNSI